MDGANTVGSRIVWKDGMPRSQKSQGINNGHSRSGIHALPTFDGDAVNASSWARLSASWKASRPRTARASETIE
jgi:hypothetical protein